MNSNRFRCCLLIVLFGGVFSPSVLADEKTDGLLRQAGEAAEKGKFDEALEFIGQAVELVPKDTNVLFFRAQILLSARRFNEAVKDYTHIMQLDPKSSRAYYLRGRANFCAGKPVESVADFDEYLKRLKNPRASATLWERGISLYYAGQYKQGAKQFQTDYNSDVEEAVWRYLCVAKTDGAEKARTGLLKVKQDHRVPMMEVYAMFAGKKKPDDVFAAAESGQPGKDRLRYQKFYAHLYVGLYYDALGKSELALKHLQSAKKLKTAHYMWDVVNVHVKLLAESKKKTK